MFTISPSARLLDDFHVSMQLAGCTWQHNSLQPLVSLADSMIQLADSSKPHVAATQTGHQNNNSDPTQAHSSASQPNDATITDRKARKKDQNRRAAYNYRRKKVEEKNRMREEEMRLVYSRICLIGYADELESTIMYILNTKTRKIVDRDGRSLCFLCPICPQTCDNAIRLRTHLKVMHNHNYTR